VVTFDEQIILGPYPTAEEWFNSIIRWGTDEIVSTLRPDDSEDIPWIEKKRRIAEENDLVFTLMPLDPESPDPDTAREIAAYVRSRDGKVYVHDFLESERLRALESALRRDAQTAVRNPVAGAAESRPPG
jgi:protein tyrosine phosphatase (PTP) superfamily phosphohydrolase (DUF442 family)